MDATRAGSRSATVDGLDCPTTELRRPITSVQAKFAVFYGEADQKLAPGWYWTVVPGPGEPSKGPDNGPFETKADAIEIRSGAGRLH